MKLTSLPPVLAWAMVSSQVLAMPVQQSEPSVENGDDAEVSISHAYYYKQNGRVTYEHGRVSYVPSVVARGDNDVDVSFGLPHYWKRDEKRGDNDVDVSFGLPHYWKRDEKRGDNDVDVSFGLPHYWKEKRDESTEDMTYWKEKK